LRPAVERIEKQSYAKGGLANERVCQFEILRRGEEEKGGIRCSNSVGPMFNRSDLLHFIQWISIPINTNLK
jgi:hypothetical protein